jgi:transglutaminase-like putative cysteine protease
MLTVIRGYSMGDIQVSINYLLDKTAQDMNFRDFALGIVQGANDPILKVHDWVKSNVKYVPDPIGSSGEQAELFTSPLRMMENYKAGIPLGEDCDGMAIMTVALLRAIGYKANVILLDTKNNGIDHAVARVYSDKTKAYIMVDPSSSLVPCGWTESSFGSIEV